MENAPIPDMPLNPIQNPEAFLDWIEAVYGTEMRRSEEPFWRRRDPAEEVEGEQEHWGLRADWTYEEEDTFGEQWDVDENE